MKPSAGIQRAASGLGVTLFLLAAVWGRAGLLLTALLTGLAILAGICWEVWRGPNGGNPCHFLLLSPLLSIHYSSAWDFRIRLFSFFLLCVIAAAALLPPRPRLRASLHRVPAAGLLALVLALLSATAGLLYQKGIYLSGDEPHYLLIAQSLVDDGDIDLTNNMERKTYLAFHPVEIAPGEFHGSAHGSRRVPFHLPGLPVLLAPFYWLHSRLLRFIPAQLFFRLAAAIINSFLALALFRILRRKFAAADVSPIWLLLIATFPFLFHAVHLYPELPAAALMLGAYQLASGDKNRLLPAGLLLAMVPWFHVKYAIPCAVLGAWVSCRQARAGRWKNAFLFLAPQAAGWFGLMLYTKVFYESWNPNAIFPPADILAAPVMTRIETFLSYFLDQRDGLLLVAPFVLFVFFGWRRKMADRGLLLAVLFSYLGFHAFTTTRGAYSPAGRPLMFVYWIAALFIANYLLAGREGEKAGFRLASGLAFFSLAWVFYHPLFAYQPVTAQSTQRASDLLSFLGSTDLNLAALFPSFLKKYGNARPANFLWLAVLGAALFFHYRGNGSGMRRIPRRLAAWLFIALSGALLCFWPHVHVSFARRFVAPGKTFAFFNNSGNFVQIQGGSIFRIKPGLDYDIFLDLDLIRRESLAFSFSGCDRAGVTLWSGRRILFRSPVADTAAWTLSPAALHRLRAGGFRLAHLGFETCPLAKGAFLFLKIE